MKETDDGKTIDGQDAGAVPAASTKHQVSYQGIFTFAKAMNEYYYTPNKPHTNTDMEVIYAPKGSKVMYDFLKFVETQIKEKSKTLPKSWKVRYIFYTTGPRSLMKFLKKHDIEYDEIKSNLGKEDSLRKFKGVDYDVVSYFSMSYNPHAKNVGYTKKKKK